MSKRLAEFDTLSPAHDARQGHGYGHTGKPTGAGTTWSAADDFPYIEIEEDELENADDYLDNPGEASKFMTKLGTHYYSTHDPYGKSRARVDRQSFAHSSNRGLGESGMPAVASGISPFPKMYKNRGPGIGGMAPTAYKTGMGSYGGIGSKKGWWGKPPPRPTDDDEEAFTWREFLTDDERALSKAQKSHEDLVGEYECMFDELDWSDDEE